MAHHQAVQHGRRHLRAIKEGSPPVEKTPLPPPVAAPESAAEAKSAAAQDPAESTSGAERQLLATLLQELFQTEQSAKVHPAREAERLGATPPAAALRAVSAHAARVLEELPALTQRCGLELGLLGRTTGQMLSNLRQWVIDRLVEPERSYRATLLGMRHGVDLISLISQLAQAQGNHDLAKWCARWQSERVPLVESVAVELSWFAQSPQAAIAAGGGRFTKALKHVLGFASGRFGVSSP